jgi:AraC-like DNA-binding protein
MRPFYYFFFALLFWHCTFTSLAQITIRVKEVPENTPPDANLYLVGNFNEWQTGQPAYKMQRQADGTFTFTFAADFDSISYKITRSSSWKTVEGRSNGRARPNRILIHRAKKPITQEIVIESWEDLEGHTLSAYILVLLIAAIQGLILIIAINKLQNNNQKANRILSAMLLLVSVALFGRVAVNFREIFDWQPKIYLSSDIVLFSYAPLFYLYLRELLTLPLPNRTSGYYHAIPFVVHCLVYAYMLFMPREIFVTDLIDNELAKIFVVTGFTSFIYNAVYWFKSWQLFEVYRNNVLQTHSFEQNLQYLYSVFAVKALCLAVWLFTLIYGGLGMIFQFDYLKITEYSVDAVWIAFSGMVYCLGYFAMQQPAIFKLSPIEGSFETSATPHQLSVIASPTLTINTTLRQDDQETDTQERPLQVIEKEEVIVATTVVNTVLTPSIATVHTTPDKNILQLEMVRKKLETLIQKEKPYLEPELTLPDIANKLRISTHILSKVINEMYQKNFHDFINSYRIEEFKQLVKQPKFRGYTIVSVAMEAGFNSKSSFNRAFKKLVGITPSEYLKSLSLDIKDD